MIISDSILAANPVSTRGSDLGYVIGMPHSGFDRPFPVFWKLYEMCAQLVLVVILHQLPCREPISGDCPVMKCKCCFCILSAKG